MAINLIVWACAAAFAIALLWHFWTARDLAVWRKVAFTIGLAVFVYAALTGAIVPSGGIDLLPR